MFSALKLKIYAVGVAIIAALLAIIKVMASRNARLKTEYNAVKNDLQFREKTDSLDAEIELEFSELKREADKDVANDEIPDHLASPSNN